MSNLNRPGVPATIAQLLPKRWALAVVDGGSLTGQYVSIESVFGLGNEEAKLLTENPDNAYTWLSCGSALDHKAALATTVDPELHNRLTSVELPYDIGQLSRVANNTRARYEQAWQAAEAAFQEVRLVEARLQEELDRLVHNGNIDVVRGNQLRVGDVIIGTDGKRKTVTGAELHVTYDGESVPTKFGADDNTTVYKLRA